MKFKNFLKISIVLISCHKVFAVSQNYEMEISDGNKTGRQTMTINQKEDTVEITVIDEKKEKQMVQYNKNMELQKVQYINDKAEKFLEVTYDYKNKKIYVSNDIKKKYNLTKNMYDNNASLFYFFSRVYPEKNKLMEFTLLQSKLKRTVDMYLKLVDEEELNINGEKIKAFKYEMGLSSRMMAAFWPYKYYYWYDTKDHRFLKYEGIDENKKTQTVQLIRYHKGE